MGQENEKISQTLRATEFGVSRQSLYYKPKKPDKDWQLKCRIEEVLRTPGKHSYGSRRIALDLKMNRKPVKRVMNLFGIKITIKKYISAPSWIYGTERLLD
ncbi:MAG: hypothetical protein AAB814_01660 [Patescibacteria group bacterium]